MNSPTLRKGTFAEVMAPPTNQPSLYARRLAYDRPGDKETHLLLRQSASTAVETNTGYQMWKTAPDNAAQREMLQEHEDGSGYWVIFLRIPELTMDFPCGGFYLSTYRHRQTWGYGGDYWREYLSHEYQISGNELEEALDSTLYFNQFAGGASMEKLWIDFINNQRLDDQLRKEIANPLYPFIDSYRAKVRDQLSKKGIGSAGYFSRNRPIPRGTNLSLRSFICEERKLKVSPFVNLSRELSAEDSEDRTSSVSPFYSGVRWITQAMMSFIDYLSLSCFNRSVIRFDAASTSNFLSDYYRNIFISKPVAAWGDEYACTLFEHHVIDGPGPPFFCEDVAFLAGNPLASSLDYRAPISCNPESCKVELI